MQTKIIGTVFIIIGMVMMIYTVFNFGSSENVVDSGFLIRKAENHPVQWAPIISAVLLAGGIVTLSANKTKRIRI